MLRMRRLVTNRPRRAKSNCAECLRSILSTDAPSSPREPRMFRRSLKDRDSLLSQDNLGPESFVGLVNLGL